MASKSGVPHSNCSSEVSTLGEMYASQTSEELNVCEIYTSFYKLIWMLLLISYFIGTFTITGSSKEKQIFQIKLSYLFKISCRESKDI